MSKKISSALISVFNKEGLEPIIKKLQELNITIYSTGGTQQFIESLDATCLPVEGLTGFPSILGGRVKTLHPKIFGGILARRDFPEDVAHLNEYQIPVIDLVIVDLYPFEETVKQTTDHAAIIEKIDIGGVSLIRAAAKNYKDVCIAASQNEYADVLNILQHDGISTLEERLQLSAKAFQVCAHYDVAIADYFNNITQQNKTLRYGENPHQKAIFKGDIQSWFTQLNGKELSYNNLVDVDAACQLIAEFEAPTFAVIKHTNVCGIASRDSIAEAWKAAKAGDPESAFGGVLIANKTIDMAAAQSIHELFFEILIAPDFSADALEILKGKKNRILLQQKKSLHPTQEFKRILDGTLQQESDSINNSEWEESGARQATDKEIKDLRFANIVCKHLKSNAIALVRDEQLIGKGAGQTSRIDALRHAIEKAHQFNFNLKNAVMASDAFFPFDDCIRMAYQQGITAVIQPGGSMRDQETIDFAKQNDMAMIITGTRHFRH